MTWKEFRLKHFAWKRMQKRLDYRQRQLEYRILCSNWMDKKKPPSINAYWPLDKQNDDEILRGLEALKRAKEKKSK